MNTELLTRIQTVKVLPTETESGRLQQVSFNEAIRILVEGGKVFASPIVSHTLTRSRVGSFAVGTQDAELKRWIGDTNTKTLRFAKSICGIYTLHEGPFYSNAPTIFPKEYLSHGQWDATASKRKAILEAEKISKVSEHAFIDPRAVLRESPIQFTDYSGTSGRIGVTLRNKFGGLNKQFLLATREDNPTLSTSEIIALIKTYAQSFGFKFRVYPDRVIDNAITVQFADYNLYIEIPG